MAGSLSWIQAPLRSTGLSRFQQPGWLSSSATHDEDVSPASIRQRDPTVIDTKRTACTPAPRAASPRV
jgi:hypothetical protein